MKFPPLILAALLAATAAHGQITVVSGTPASNEVGINQSYGQSFNGLSNASVGTTVPWVDNATLPGWYAAKGAPGSVSATTSFLTGATGSVSQAGTLYSLAQHFNTTDNNSPTSTWRALGAIPANSSQPALVALRLKNNTGGMLSGLRLFWETKWGYTGSAVGSPTTGKNALTLRYRKFSAGSGSLSSSPTGWTTVSSAQFENSDISNDDDWNQSNERISGLSVADGEELWLCWEISAVSGSPVALAIDNVRVTDFAGANPRITQQPLSAAVKKTNDTYFQVEAVGSGTLSYQWRRNGADIDGANSARYNVTSASSSLNASSYTCLVSNAYGSALSEPARLTVYTALAARGPAVPTGYPYSTSSFTTDNSLFDITYLPASRSQKADIYLPDPLPSNCPAVVIVHGGGGNDGDKHQDRETQAGIELAKRGYVAMSINYKMGFGSWPRNVQDTFYAVRWLRANAATYNIDPDRIGAIGFSWGSNMVSMLSTIQPTDTFNGERLDGVVIGDSTTLPGYSSSVSASAAFYGAVDVGNYHQMNMHGSTTTADDDPARYFAAAPINHVHSGAAPLYLSHGTSDLEVMMTQHLAMRDRMRDVGARVEYNLVPYGMHSYALSDDGSHIDSGAPVGTDIDERPQAFGFLDKYLRNDPPSISAATLTPSPLPLNATAVASISASDANSDSLTYTWAKVSGPGNATFSSNGTSSASSLASFSAAGTYVLSATVFDGNVTTTSFVTTTVAAAASNAAPSAANDSATTSQTSPVTLSVLANDSDSDGGTLSIQGVSQPAHGSVTINGAATLTYTPESTYAGTDTFTYTITDSQGGTDTATVNLAVTGVATSLLTVQTEATVASATPTSDVDEAAQGYVTTKYNAALTSARKAYFQFDVSALSVDPSGSATLTISFTNSFQQRVQLWALNQAYGGFTAAATWNNAQANDTSSNSMLTSGGSTATAIGSSTVIPVTSTNAVTFTIPSIASYVKSGKVTLVLAGENDAANNTSGARYSRNSATLLVPTVNSNSAPTISNLSNLSLNEDTASGSIAFTIGDTETAAGSLSVSATSSNAELLPSASLSLGGSGASRTLQFTPASNQSGTSVISITVTDAGGASVSDNFVLTVLPINDPPTISGPATLTLSANTASSAQAFTVGDIETVPGLLSVTASSSNTALLPQENIVLAGTDAARTLTLTPASGQIGSATVTVTVSDGTTSTSTALALSVTGTQRQTWWFENFGTLEPGSGSSSLTDDPDGDGMNNLFEYSQGANPALPDAAAYRPSLTVSGANLRFTYRKAAADLTYGVDQATSLSSPDWSPTGASETANGDGTFTRSVPISGTSLFLRLNVTAP